MLLTTDAVGGVWRYTLDLATHLVPLGITPAIAVLGPAPSPAQRAEAASRALGLHETGLDLDWTAPDQAALARTTAALQDCADRLGAVTSHLHAPALAGNVPWPIPVVSVAHSCTATWWRANRAGPLPADFAWREAATAAGLHVSNAVIAPTRAHARAVGAAYDVHPIVVHNGTDMPRAQRTTRERAVFAAGRLWDEGKNLAALDDAAPRLDAPVYAAGPTAGPNGAEIALPHLRLLGERPSDEMTELYRRFAVFVSLARYEPFGLSVLEAARAGMRLVLSDIPSFRELWDGAASFVPLGADPLPAIEAALAEAGDGGAGQHSLRYDLESTARATLAAHRAVGAPL